MLGTSPELDLLGEFWVDGSDQPIPGALALKFGRQPELTLVGEILAKRPKSAFLDSDLPSFAQIFGRVINPATNRGLEVVLINTRCYRSNRSLFGTPNVFWFRAWLAVVAAEVGGDFMFTGLDISLSGYSEANRPVPAEVLARGAEPTFRSEPLGSVHGLSLSTALISSVEHGSGRRSFRWEEVLRLERDAPVGYAEGPMHAAAVLSGYSVLSGKYVPVNRLSFFGSDPSGKRWDGDVYGRFGLEWAAVEPGTDHNGWELVEAQDKVFLVNWLDFFFNTSLTATDLFEALQFWKLAASGTPIDWAGLLVRLGVLSEALFSLQAEPAAKPSSEVFRKIRRESEAKITEAISAYEGELTPEEVAYLGGFRVTWDAERRPTLVEKLRVLVRQLERRLELPLVHIDTIREWKNLRTASAHPSDLSSRRERAPRAIRQWTAVLNAWVLMHLGASTAAICNVLVQAKLLQTGQDTTEPSES